MRYKCATKNTVLYAKMAASASRACYTSEQVVAFLDDDGEAELDDCFFPGSLVTVKEIASKMTTVILMEEYSMLGVCMIIILQCHVVLSMYCHNVIFVHYNCECVLVMGKGI